MKKVELLSPVGNKESLYMAIHNGCDAVYFAGKNFGARKYANNFTNEEIKEAVEYAHLYGVKVYITVNILIFDDEVEDCLNFIKYLYEIGVDALIMQDLGLISLTRKMYPNMEIHASTQCHNHNEYGIKFLEDLGVTRIVLDRELSLDEVKDLNINLEKEIFIHGALCVSYSGCCLFSSMNGGRSGNRGECVASCRTPFKLLKNGQELDIDGDYPLSTKELNTLNNIDKIIESNVNSLKIEGRMKSPEYVGYITRLYRKVIDDYYNGCFNGITKEELINLKKIYNRDFTKGYLFNEEGKSLMNIKTPNHQGVEIGKVISNDNKFIKIKLSDYLNQGDAVRLPNNKGMYVNRLYNEKELLINHGEPNQIVLLDNKENNNITGKVLKTIDIKLLEDINNTEKKRIDIDIVVNAYLNKELELIITDGVNTVKQTGIVVDQAKNSPTDKDSILKQINRLEDTPFRLRNISINNDKNIFIPVSKINELRRNSIDELISLRKRVNRDIIIINKYEITKDKFISSNKKINILVRNEDQLNIVLKYNINNIYTEDINLYNKYKDKCNIYLKLPRVNLKYRDYNNERLLVTELGSLERYKNNNDLVIDYTMNCTNHNTYNLYKNNNANLVTLSVEVPYNNLVDNTNKYYDGEFFTYGRVELMIMKYCPLKMLVNKEDNCSVCLKGDTYGLKDTNDNIFPIKNTLHYTHIYNKEVTNNINRIGVAKKLGISNYRIDLFDENEDEIVSILDKIYRELGD